MQIITYFAVVVGASVALAQTPCVENTFQCDSGNPTNFQQCARGSWSTIACNNGRLCNSTTAAIGLYNPCDIAMLPNNAVCVDLSTPAVNQSGANGLPYLIKHVQIAGAYSQANCNAACAALKTTPAVTYSSAMQYGGILGCTCYTGITATFVSSLNASTSCAQCQSFPPPVPSVPLGICGQANAMNGFILSAALVPVPSGLGSCSASDVGTFACDSANANGYLWCVPSAGLYVWKPYQCLAGLKCSSINIRKGWGPCDY